MTRAIFTIVAKNYLAHARTLMESVAALSPDVQRFVILVDKPDGHFDPSAEPYRTIRSEELDIPALRWFHFKYTVVELSTAVKPYAAQILLERFSVDRLLYLDPDILLYQSLEPIWRRLDDSDILLTPHLTAPIDDGCRPSELDILRSGSYNLGFLAIRRSPTSQAVLEWWQRRLYDHCVVSPEQGLFVDQRWIDLIPGLFSGVEIVRDPTWNVAYWNVQSRPVHVDNGVPTVFGQPLLFFHFSGFDPLRPGMFSRHQDRFLTRDLGDGAKLVEGYKEALLRHQFVSCRAWPYSWSVFEDGSTIPDIARPVHHEDSTILDTVDDPFSEAGRRAFAEVWNRPATDHEGRPSALTRMALRIYSVRTDVQATMPDVFGADAKRFQEWFVTSGQREHGLPEFLVKPMRGALRSIRSSEVLLDEPHSGGRNGSPAPDWLEALLWNVPGLRRRLAEQYETSQFGAPEIVDAIERHLCERQNLPGWSAPPPRVAELILAARPDVQERCRNAEHFDERWYLAWLSTYGFSEYCLPSALRDAVENHWKEVIGSGGVYAGLQARVRRWALGASAGRRSIRAATPAAGLPSLARPAEGHPAARQFPQTHSSTNNGGRGAREQRAFGVNLVGYVRAEMGVGESVRLAHDALREAGVPVAVRGISTGGVYSERDRRLEEDNSLPYSFDIFHVNADSFEYAVTETLGSLHHPEFTLGYWAWELEEFPERLDEAFRFCGEIWTPSEFCRRAIEGRSPVPVVAIPHPIRPRITARYGRDTFLVDYDRFLFLCMADMLSVPARKNPLAAIEAFRRAAPEMPGAEMVVKVNNARHDVSAMNEIRSAASDGPIRVLDRVLSRDEVDSLIGCADCFVSLHRSEGFGLPLAEAMSLGTPVIATAYSGNMDFMDDECAYLVDYELGAVPAGCEPYRQGAVWAEPSIDHGATQMVAAFSDSRKRVGIAAAGRHRVHTQLHPARIGQRMLNRLRVIAKRHRSVL